MLKLSQTLPVIGMSLFITAAHAACGQDSSDEAVKACLAQDLRDSDKRINAVYKSLMDLNDEAGKAQLRDEQRAWLKNRDKTCKLPNKESGREKWLQSILANQEQTVCVARYTFSRVAALDQVLRQKAPNKPLDAPSAPSSPQFQPNANAAQEKLPASLTFEDDGYKARTANSHERGKWYYEVWIDRGHIAEAGDVLMTPGYTSATNGVIRMVNVRRTQAGMPPIVVGLALDLDGGFVYIQQDGAWKVAPGVAGAVVVPLTGPYVGMLHSSAQVRELIERGLVRVNVGERPFAHAAPAGYRAWGEN